MISIGVFGDAHFVQNKIYSERHCGLSLDKIKNCIREFNRAGVDFAVNLGDVIDSAGIKARDAANLRLIAGAFSKLAGEMHTVLGNHDLETLDKHEFLDALEAGRAPYYSFDRENHHFIILDADYRSDGAAYFRGNYRWEDSFVPDIELKWLEKDLSRCGCGDATIFIHQNLDTRQSNGLPDPHCVKNAGEVRAVLEASGKKITVFQGHFHPGYKQTINDIDYITLKAMCTGTDAGSFSYMILHIDESGRISVADFG